MSEPLRPTFEETNNTEEPIRQREMARAYLGEVSLALCAASAESVHTIGTIIGLNMKLRDRGVYELPQVAAENKL